MKLGSIRSGLVGVKGNLLASLLSRHRTHIDPTVLAVRSYEPCQPKQLEWKGREASTFPRGKTIRGRSGDGDGDGDGSIHRLRCI